MKLLIKKVTSTNQRCLVEIRERRDGLWEVEGFVRTTEILPDYGSYTFMEPALGLVLTDTPANAEKLALQAQGRGMNQGGYSATNRYPTPSSVIK